MRVYVDTSAFLAVLDADDTNHPAALKVWRMLVTEKWELICNNYVLLETMALVQARLGMAAAQVVNEDLLPLFQVDWIDDVQHAAAAAALFVARRRGLSFVDCGSFQTAKRLGIDTAFAFDRHFAEHGFNCLPPHNPA